ncbi:MAG: hypothetical protein QNL88_11995 [Acidobacteriota bacterium]|nr:hypothetical protein [Acidobacteriota bacterium]
MQNPLKPWRIGVALLVTTLVVPPATAGVDAVFADGFESGDTTVWERPTRYVVFEGFYVPT